jgi:hypothetical protein
VYGGTKNKGAVVLAMLNMSAPVAKPAASRHPHLRVT